MPNKKGGLKRRKAATSKNGKRMGRPPKEPRTYVIETGIPIPGRADRNLEAKQKARDTLKSLKLNQSYVILRKELSSNHTVIKNEFANYVIRTSALPPDKKFVRLWRKK